MPDAPPPAPSQITLSEIVTVFIRLLAINFGLYSLNTLFITVTQIFPATFTYSRYGGNDLHLFQSAIVVLFFLVVYWLWSLAGFVARRVTKGHNSTLSATQLTLLDLYSFGFLLIGLYIAVENFGPSLTWLHYAVTHSASEVQLTPEQKSNFYTLFNYLVKLIIGLALVFNGRKLAAKLLKRYHVAA